MRHRPKRHSYPGGEYGASDYHERLERYCTYLENQNKKLKEDKWIHVTEGLPEEDLMCLCFCEEEPLTKYFIGSYVNNLDIFIDYDEYPADVSHWQELPQAPKKNKEQ